MKQIDKCTLYRGDCLKVMKKIPDNSVDMILCDLPYGTTPLDWDKVLDLNELWKHYIRITKKTSAIVLFSVQPFTSLLITSNLKYYKYNWVWIKENITNFLNIKYQPGKITEDICVFGKGITSPSKGVHMTYNPQKLYGFTKFFKVRRTEETSAATYSSLSKKTNVINEDGSRLPKNILAFKRDAVKLHPTQKPIKLLEYLIKTYTNENNVVLDNTMGSGSTGVACQNLNRRFIGIEKDKKYFNIAYERIKNNRSTF